MKHERRFHEDKVGGKRSGKKGWERPDAAGKFSFFRLTMRDDFKRIKRVEKGREKSVGASRMLW